MVYRVLTTFVTKKLFIKRLMRPVKGRINSKSSIKKGVIKRLITVVVMIKQFLNSVV